jgi:hypothetical protein
MSYESYDLVITNSTMNFEFVSEGPNGFIKKRIRYQKVRGQSFYNLALADFNEGTGEFDASIISNNKDTEKVLATVAATIYIFTNKYPHLPVYLRGNSLARKRLYRMGISNNLDEINRDFTIFGLFEDGNLEIYEKNKDYWAFLIIKK